MTTDRSSKTYRDIATHVKIVRMEPGTYCWDVAGIECELDEWQAYDFTERRWVPASDYRMFWIVPFPYPDGKNFLDCVRENAAHLPPEATVYVYMSNECFGAIRHKPG